MTLYRIKTVWFLLAVAALYVVTTVATSNAQLQEVIRIMQFSVATGAAAVLWREFRVSVAKPFGELAPEDLAVMAFFITAVGQALIGIWQLINRLAGQPRFMINNDLYGSYIFMVLIGLTLMVAVSGAREGRITNKARFRVVAWWIGGAALCAFVMMRQPNLAPVVEWLRPLLEEHP